MKRWMGSGDDSRHRNEGIRNENRINNQKKSFFKYVFKVGTKIYV